MSRIDDEQLLTPEERRQIGIAVFTTLATTAAARLVDWAIEEVKTRTRRRRERLDEERAARAVADRGRAP